MRRTATFALAVAATLALAPAAWSTRAPTSNHGDGATAQSSEAAVKPIDPVMNMTLWPRRSASFPNGTSSAANTIV